MVFQLRTIPVADTAIPYTSVVSVTYTAVTMPGDPEASTGTPRELKITHAVFPISVFVSLLHAAGCPIAASSIGGGVPTLPKPNVTPCDNPVVPPEVWVIQQQIADVWSNVST